MNRELLIAPSGKRRRRTLYFEGERAFLYLVPWPFRLTVRLGHYGRSVFAFHTARGILGRVFVWKVFGRARHRWIRLGRKI